MKLGQLFLKVRVVSSAFARPTFVCTQGFRSNAALEALAKASENKVENIVFYNYPSFSGAYSALFAHLFYSHIHSPCLILPFSKVEPLRVEDVCIDGLKTCYFLDFLGPKGFAAELSRKTMCQVIAFDHRKSVVSKISIPGDCSQKLMFHVDTERSSSTMAYEYFSAKLSERKSNDLLKICAMDLIQKGNSQIRTRQEEAKKLLDRVFRVRLGRGFYGDCLGVRADGSSSLSDEIGNELSIRSSAAGLRPIGAVIYMQGKNLKMCLRSTDKATDTSEVAKAYGGGGSPCSSSFNIRMDEYNQWLSVSTS